MQAYLNNVRINMIHLFCLFSENVKARCIYSFFYFGFLFSLAIYMNIHASIWEPFLSIQPKEMFLLVALPFVVLSELLNCTVFMFKKNTVIFSVYLALTLISSFYLYETVNGYISDFKGVPRTAEKIKSE
jgi:hypothetical protein